MQAKKRHIKDGRAFETLFPAAKVDTQTILREAGVSDTVAFIPKVVAETLDQTRKISDRLRGKTLLETCSNIWNFVYNHINYAKDKEGYEQIRSPARTWRDRKEGVDCDCYSTFISSILTNLRIPHRLRITKYHKDYFQHIYPIVPTGNSYITLDCVTDKFNYEVSFSEHKDFNMDLQYLNGLGSNNYRGEDYILDGYGMGELGLFGKKKRKAAEAAAAAAPADPNAIPGSGVKKKKGLKKLFSKVNKINPVTVLLRNGVLAAMKLNIAKLASRLRYSFISPNDAVKRGIDPAKFQKLVQVRQKLENIFYGAGGNPDNLRKAILKGKGNKDKSVAIFGLGYLDSDRGVEFMNAGTPLSQLLGPEIYYSENVDGMDGFDGFGELGEPITGATLAAASSVIAVIAGLLKSVGNIFGKGQKEGADFADEVADAGVQEAAQVKSASPNAPVIAAEENNPLPASSTPAYSSAGNNYDESDSGKSASTSMMVSSVPDAALPVSTIGNDNAASLAPKTGSFWQNNKKWLLPVGIGVGGIALIVIGAKILKPTQRRPAASLNGHSRKNHRRKKKQIPKSGIERIALL